MLRLGNTPATLVDMPEEAFEAISIDPRSKVFERIGVDEYLVVTGTGRTHAKSILTYQDISLSEFNLLKQYCSPYVIKVWSGEVVNSDGIKIQEGTVYAKMLEVKVNYDSNLYSCKVIVQNT